MRAANTYNLNQGQQEAADAFMAFLFTDAKEFIISGRAGVGKTYLMNYIIDNTMPRYAEMCKLLGAKQQYVDVVMTATTNKAAEVLSQATGRPTSTVHSFFNLRVYDDYETGKTTIAKTRNWIVHNRRIIFIDEASMIDSELWKVIGEGTADCKIVYVGDHNQLAPVFEDLSPIYKQRSPFFELTEPVRNAGQPALMAVCQQLRESVETGVFKPIAIVPDVIEHLDDEAMVRELQLHFAVQTHGSRFLAWSNKQVIAVNDYIRNMRGLPAEYQAGEYLVMTNAFQATNKAIIPVETGVEVLRADQFEELVIDKAWDVKLKVGYLDIRTDLGETFYKVPYPVDRSHLDALIKFYNKTQNWERKFYLKQRIADLRPRDAATVHKAQGSTYNSVFIDLDDISRCNDRNQVARLLYVAFSRARGRVYLYGNLAEKYGGLTAP